MRLLLDTHVFLWWVYDDPKISNEVRALIFDVENTKYVSAVTAWELSIKASLGKLRLHSHLDKFFSKYTAENYFEVLPIELMHIYQTEHLPHHHKDPFDRLLVAQAKTESLQLISADTAFDAYGIKRVW
jgi:PIN domain nuclease of toxin-antitoxin system